MVAIPPRRDSLKPAMAAAFALHLGVFLVVTLLAPSPPMGLSGAVPINIVSDAQVTDSAPAIQGPREQTPATTTPADQGDPTPAAAIAPTPKQPAKAVPSPALKRQAFNLDSIAATVAQAAAAEHAKSGRAPVGPPRPRMASEVRIDAAQGVSQSDMQGLQQLLERLWNPTCSVEGADAVVVPVKFSVGDDGRLITRATASGASVSTNPAAARRAIDAVHQAEPYASAYRGKSFTVVFDAQKACAGR